MSRSEYVCHMALHSISLFCSIEKSSQANNFGLQSFETKDCSIDQDFNLPPAPFKLAVTIISFIWPGGR